MAYTAVDIETFQKTVEKSKYMPAMLETVTGIPESFAADEIFGRTKILTNATSWFDREKIRTISLVKFSTELGKYEPIGSGSVNAAEFEPQVLKLSRSWTARELKKRMTIEDATHGQLITEMVTDFFDHKKNMYINQANQFFANGIITYPLYDDRGIVVNSGDSIDYKTYYLSGNSSTIYNYSPSDTTLVTAWDASGATGMAIWDSLKKLVKQGQTNTSKKHFMNPREIIILASDTAFAKLPALVSTTLPREQSAVRNDIDSYDYLIGFGAMTFRVRNDNLPYYTWTKSAGSGTWSATVASAITAGNILIIDNSIGNFKTIDLKFLDQDNVKSDRATPYTMISVINDTREYLNVYFRSKTLLWGDPSAFMIVDVLT